MKPVSVTPRRDYDGTVNCYCPPQAFTYADILAARRQGMHDGCISILLALVACGMIATGLKGLWSKK